MALNNYSACFTFLTNEYIRLVAEASFNRMQGNHGQFLLYCCFSSFLMASMCVSESYASVNQERASIIKSYSRLFKTAIMYACIVSFYNLFFYVFSCPDSLYSSAIDHQSGNPDPLLANQQPPSQFRRLRVLRYPSRPALWYPVTAPVAVDLQVALPTSFFSLLTPLCETPCTIDVPIGSEYHHVLTIYLIILIILTEKINVIQNRMEVHIIWILTTVVITLFYLPNVP